MKYLQAFMDKVINVDDEAEHAKTSHSNAFCNPRDIGPPAAAAAAAAPADGSPDGVLRHTATAQVSPAAVQTRCALLGPI